MKDLDLGKSKVSKIFFIYAIPALISMLAGTTAHLVDSAFIGNYVGPDGVAAITLIMPVIFLLQGVAMMIAIGGATYSGISRGKGDLEKSNNFFNITVVFILVSGIVSSVIMLLLEPYLGNMFSVSGVVEGYLKDYSSIMAVFFIMFMMNFAFSFFLNIDKKPVHAVVIMIIGSLINIILDYVFIVILKWEIRGAAFASGLSQLIPWLIYLFVIKTNSTFKFKKPTLIWNEIKLMIFNGSSEFLNTVSVSVAGLIVNALILKEIGVNGVAGYAVALQVSNLIISLSYGFAESTRAAISFNYGAEKFKRVTKLLKYSVVANLITGLVFGVIAFTFGDTVSSIFLSDQEVIEIATFILKYYAFAYVVMGVNITLGSYYTSVDSPVLSGLITFLRAFGFLIPVIYIFLSIFGSPGIWGGIVGAEFLTFATALIIYIKIPFGKTRQKLKLKTTNV